MKRVYLLILISLVFSTIQASAQQPKVVVLGSKRPSSDLYMTGVRSMLDFSHQTFNVPTPGNAKDDEWSILKAVSYTLGYQFTEHWFGGIGTQFGSVTSADAYGGPSYLNSLYLDCRYYLGSKGVPLFGDLRIGYIETNSMDQNATPGLYIAPTIGLRIPIKGRIALNLGLGYHMYSPYREAFSTVNNGGSMVIESVGKRNMPFWAMAFNVGFGF